MKVGLVAVGQAGGKIADAMLAYERETGTEFVGGVVAVNTARADLLGLQYVPLDRRVLVGQSRVKGHGAGADNELGAELAAEDSDEILGAVGDIPLHDVDAFLVVAALGGGTGSGGAPVVARELKRVYTEPVYGLGVLPSREEGGLYTLNAARSFQTFIREVDSLVVFDNDAWRQSGESLQVGYRAINEELARRLGVLFGAGEVGGQVAESVVDASEIINTLRGGGVSTIGYANSRVQRTRGVFRRLGDGRPTDDSEAVTRVTSTVRRAALGRLTLPCDIRSAERALVVVSGPPAYLSRKGIEDARNWLEEATGSMEVRGGDNPVPDSAFVSGLVVLTGVTDIPRVKELQAVAIETQRTMAEISEAAPAAFDDLLWDGDELDPLF